MAVTSRSVAVPGVGTRRMRRGSIPPKCSSKSARVQPAGKAGTGRATAGSFLIGADGNSDGRPRPAQGELLGVGAAPLRVYWGVRRATPAARGHAMSVLQRLNDPWKRWWDFLGEEGSWREDAAKCSRIHARLLRFSAAHWDAPAWVDAVLSAL